MWTHLLSTTIKQCALLAKVAEGVGGGKVAKMFADPRQFHICVYRALRYIMYAPRDLIIVSDTPNVDLLFLRRGEMHASCKGRLLFSISQAGMSVGERCMLEPAESELIDFDARSRCDVLALNRSDLISAVAEHLVPDHRVKLANDLFAEMARKGEQTRQMLKLVAANASGPDKDSLTTALTDIGEKLDALKDTQAKDAMHAVIDAEQVHFTRGSIVGIGIHSQRKGP